MKKIYLLHFTITLLALTILRIWWQGKLVLYVHPSTEWFVAVGGGAILLVSLLWTLSRNTHFHVTNAQIAGALAVVAVLTLGRNTSLSPGLAKQRQSGDSIPQMSRSTIKVSGVTSNFNVLEWWAAWESDPTHKKYQGSPVKLTGFVLKDGETLSVGRMLMTCCAVDAQPIQIDFKPTGNVPAENSWIEVEGEMGDKEGKPFINSTKITPVDEPASPYVY
ncbi:TIGR03943 family protein [soil metagenome]